MSTFELYSMVEAFEGFLEFRWGAHEDEPTIIANKMDKINEGLRDFELPLLASREIVVEDMRDRFDREVGLDGVPWKKRSPRTIRSYRSKGESFSTILRKDNHLFDAVTDVNSYDIVGNDMLINTSSWPVYWHAHDVGSTVGRNVKLPARPYVGISEQAQFSIIDIFDDFINAEIDIIRPGVSGVTMFRGAFGRIGGRISMGMPRRPQVFAFGDPNVTRDESPFG